MSSWEYRPLSDFLTAREERYKPNDSFIASFKRINKIDFTGQIHILEKPTRTDMIVVNPGDLVISGINVAKGALAVYEGDEPVVATIHYSSYTFDKNKIDIDFLKRFLKSPSFIIELQNQVKGGIKTEIKPKHLLPLKLKIPNLAEQQIINRYFNAIENEAIYLSNEITTQSTLLSQLRQAILQEAIEGKLTAGWRKENPIRKGDPDFDAEALLKKIKIEKEKLIKEGKIKKQKPLAEIKAEEVPFGLPEGWVWTRLGETIFYTDNLDIQKKLSPSTIINYVDIDSIDNKLHQIKEYKIKTVSELSSRARRVLKKGYIAYSTVRPYLENIAFIENDIENGIGSTGLNVFKSIKNNSFYVFNFLLSPYINNKYKEMMIGFNSPSITNEQFENTYFPLPPVSEQQAIVDHIEKLLSMVDELEKQVSERKEQAEQLMQAVLREAFEPAAAGR